MKRLRPACWGGALIPGIPPPSSLPGEEGRQRYVYLRSNRDFNSTKSTIATISIIFNSNRFSLANTIKINSNTHDTLVSIFSYCQAFKICLVLCILPVVNLLLQNHSTSTVSCAIDKSISHNLCISRTDVRRVSCLSGFLKLLCEYGNCDSY